MSAERSLSKFERAKTVIGGLAAIVVGKRLLKREGRQGDGTSTQQGAQEGYSPSPQSRETSITQGTPLAHTAWGNSYDKDRGEGNDAEQKEREYPANMGASTRTDSAEHIAGLKEYFSSSPSVVRELEAIEREEGLHDQPGWDVEIRSYGDAKDSLEEVEGSGTLSQSAKGHIDAIQEHMDFEYHDDADSKTGDSETSDNGDYGNGESGGDSGSEGGEGGE